MGYKLGISYCPFCNALDTVPGPVGARRRHRHRRRILVLLHNVAFATHPGGGVGQL